jgi:hypothetical protein
MLYASPRPGVVHETLGAVTGSSTGTLITASGTANAMGNWALLGTASYTFNLLTIYLAASSAAADVLVDIGIDNGASARWVLAANLRLNSRSFAGTGNRCYVLPLRVRKSAPIYARCQATTASATCRVTVTGSTQGLGGAPGYSRCVALFTAASSRGFVWDPGAVADTNAGWQQIHSGYAGRIGAAYAVMGGNATTGHFDWWLVRFAAGAAGAQRVIIPYTTYSSTGTNIEPVPQDAGLYACDVPPNRPWWIGGQGSGTDVANRMLDACLYGLVV